MTPTRRPTRKRGSASKSCTTRWDGCRAKLRIPWTLHAIDGETLPDVARLCDISVATAKRRIADAAGRLDRRLRDG